MIEYQYTGSQCQLLTMQTAGLNLFPVWMNNKKVMCRLVGLTNVYALSDGFHFVSVVFFEMLCRAWCQLGKKNGYSQIYMNALGHCWEIMVQQNIPMPLIKMFVLLLACCINKTLIMKNILCFSKKFKCVAADPLVLWNKNTYPDQQSVEG